jgi:hypothetical protein
MCVPTIVFGKVELLDGEGGKGPEVDDDLGAGVVANCSGGVGRAGAARRAAAAAEAAANGGALHV